MRAASNVVLAVCLFAGFSVGCGDDAPDEGLSTPDAGVHTKLNGSTDAGSSPTSERGNLGDASAAAPDGATVALSEAQALGFASTLSNLELAAGELGVNNAEDAAVVDYAQAVVASFGAAKARAQALDIKPEDSPAAEAFVKMADALLQPVAEASQDFDRRYLESQVSLHQAELKQYDSVLLPGASPKLVAELTTLRGELSAHLQRAQALLAR
jgi:predicted outer membrane protein